MKLCDKARPRGSNDIFMSFPIFAFSHLVSNMITNIPKLPHLRHSSRMEIRPFFSSTHLSISNHMLIPEPIIVVKEISTLIFPPGCCDFPEMKMMTIMVVRQWVRSESGSTVIFISTNSAREPEETRWESVQKWEKSQLPQSTINKENLCQKQCIKRIIQNNYIS